VRSGQNISRDWVTALLNFQRQKLGARYGDPASTWAKHTRPVANHAVQASCDGDAGPPLTPADLARCLPAPATLLAVRMRQIRAQFPLAQFLRQLRRFREGFAGRWGPKPARTCGLSIRGFAVGARPQVGGGTPSGDTRDPWRDSRALAQASRPALGPIALRACWRVRDCGRSSSKHLAFGGAGKR